MRLFSSRGKCSDVGAGEASGVRSVNGSITSVFRLLEFERKEKCEVSGVRGGVMGRDGGRDDGEMEGAGGGYDMDSDD